jgi:flagellar M-ring protein FliF
LGLTSFVQGVTRVRALEGELARTIQLMRGIKAARVHIVMGEDGTFRRARQPPPASVVVRTETPDAAIEAKAIQHLVAAAVPGMTLAAVTVLSTDGALLSSGEDRTDEAPTAAGPDQAWWRRGQSRFLERQTVTHSPALSKLK